MGRKRKIYATQAETLTRFITREHNQELAGQTKLKHYYETKSQQISCEMCGKTECMLHRHRIRPGGEYTDENVVVVCVPCHKLIHRIYKETKATDERAFRLAIVLVKMEKDKERK